MRNLRRLALAILLASVPLTGLLAGPLTAPARSEPAWTTYHRDAARSGDDPDAIEPIAPVQAWQTTSLGAPIWGQPLVLGSRVYVATVGDELYALNASTGAVEWQTSAGVPVPSDELPCGDIEPTVGIVSTPVIDVENQMIYAVADTWNAATRQAQHVLDGFALAHGELVVSTPVDPPGVNPETLLQRSALNLDEGSVVFGFGENFGSCSGDLAPIVAVPESGGQARFWQDHDGAGPTTAGGMWATSGAAVDGSGDIFAATANPLPPPGQEATVYDYSDSVIKLSLSDFSANPLSEPLSPGGWFAPPEWEFLSNHDLDLGSAGTEPLPGGLLFQAGKNGKGFLIEEATMGSGAPAVFSGEVCENHGSFGGDSYALGVIYIPCTSGMQALAYKQAEKKFAVLWHGPPDAFGPPIVSGGLVWDVASGGFHGGGQTLYGLDPSTGKPVYTETLPSPVIDHFASPSAAGGRLFVATGCSVTAYQISQNPAGGEVAPSGAGDVGCPPNIPPVQSNPPGTTPPVAAPGASSGASASALVAPTPSLLHTVLKATAGGRVKLALRCAARVGHCRGTVALAAKITVTTRRHDRQVRRVVLVALARAPFSHARGDFTVTIQLSASARAHLRRHGGRLALAVTISSPASRTRVVSAVLD